MASGPVPTVTVFRILPSLATSVTELPPPEPLFTTQTWTPSKATSLGLLNAAENVFRTIPSLARTLATALASNSVTQKLAPSNASPPVLVPIAYVATTAPSLALSLVRGPPAQLVVQMLVPSKATLRGCELVANVPNTVPSF